MALSDFPIVPLVDENDETVRINKYSINDVRVVNLGRTEGQNENWFVQVNMLMGKYYLLRDGNAPYSTKSAAITARDTFLTNIGT